MASDIASISAQQTISENQALVLSEALKSAKIDIVGGDGQFFEQIAAATRGGKAMDRFVLGSKVATDIKETFFTGNPDQFRDRLGSLIEQLQLSSGDLKNLSVAALIAKLLGSNNTESLRSQLVSLLGVAGSLNLADKPIESILNNGK